MTGEPDLPPSRIPVTAGNPAVGFGVVWHRRNAPNVHQFNYRVNQLWLDPDDPEALCDLHPLWSSTGPRPIQFRQQDYFDGTAGPIGPKLRAMIGEATGSQPNGPIRMLTQPRTWGWMFNPITVYFAWNGDGASDPIGAVLEVTNTPWKERFMYPLCLKPTEDRLVARFSKELHVSPFLDEDYDYHLSISEKPGRRLLLGINVHRPDHASSPVVETTLDIGLHEPDSKTLTKALYRNLAPTHRVSLGIHWQAARLAKKRIPFISHPRKRQ